MRIILQENVEKLGSRGEVVEVADGFARNYLLPRELAIPATQANLKRLEKIRASLSRRDATEKESAQQLAQSLASVSLAISRKAGENDQLFGSVTSADIAAALEAQGFKIDKRRIQLEDPIKLIGEYTVPVRLLHDVAATVRLAVTRQE